MTSIQRLVNLFHGTSDNVEVACLYRDMQCAAHSNPMLSILNNSGEKKDNEAGEGSVAPAL